MSCCSRMLRPPTAAPNGGVRQGGRLNHTVIDSDSIPETLEPIRKTTVLDLEPLERPRKSPHFLRHEVDRRKRDLFGGGGFEDDRCVDRGWIGIREEPAKLACQQRKFIERHDATATLRSDLQCGGHMRNATSFPMRLQQAAGGRSRCSDGLRPE